jgi:thymidylate kinase
MERRAALNELAAVIAEIRMPHPTCVAIDGRDGAGKTTFVDELLQPLLMLDLHQIFSLAVDEGHVGKNPARLLVTPKSVLYKGWSFALLPHFRA